MHKKKKETALKLPSIKITWTPTCFVYKEENKIKKSMFKALHIPSNIFIINTVLLRLFTPLVFGFQCSV